MKNIYIIGAPRTGKTTFSKILKDKYPFYNQISFEAIRNAFIKTQPNLNMENRNSDSRINLLPDFIFEFAKWNNKMTNNPCIIEGSFITLDKIKNTDDIIICLGHNLQPLNAIINNIIKFQNKLDYTYNWDLNKLKNHFYDIEKIDKINYNFAKKYNIKYYDTTKNRTKIFKEIIQDIDNEQDISFK